MGDGERARAVEALVASAIMAALVSEPNGGGEVGVEVEDYFAGAGADVLGTVSGVDGRGCRSLLPR